MKRHALPLLLALLLLAGCDTVDTGTDSLVLRESAEFRFQFNASSGGALTADSETLNDFADELRALGTSKGEVLSVRLTGATVSLVNPTLATFAGSLDGLELRMRAPGSTTSAVAELTSPPDDDEAALDLVDADVTEYITASQFGAQLAFTGLAPESYVFEVELDFRIEAEGV